MTSIISRLEIKQYGINEYDHVNLDEHFKLLSKYFKKVSFMMQDENCSGSPEPSSVQTLEYTDGAQ